MHPALARPASRSTTARGSRAQRHASAGRGRPLSQRRQHQTAPGSDAPPAAAAAAVAAASTGPGPSSCSPESSASSSSATAASSSPAASGGLPGGLTPELLARYGLSAEQHRQMDTYLDHMLEVNQTMNLTAVRDKGDAWQRHVVDSLALLPVIERHASAVGLLRPAGPGVAGPEGGAAEARRASGGGAGSSSSGGGGGVELRLIDVGTGAGLPGMILAAARPQWKVTLLDTLRKRCDFLKEAAARAGLTNVDVVWCRAEEGGRRPELRQAYDVAVARAVAETRILAELCMPFVRTGGLWVAAKGPDPEAEVAAASNAIGQLGGRKLALERVSSTTLAPPPAPPAAGAAEAPTEGAAGEVGAQQQQQQAQQQQFTALVVLKDKSTPARFPRQPGTPNKKPL
ncbi:hypothetical protein HXX76_008795 [Chlamydomonas incerta]|uniref:Uncharacterized protein n=1 Tax=Chlamydomonas incerta TaxID=51695 RepID=A0A835T4R3_CHLIN|nr:hypothetical protein HXX76_008795 [Chlamydomonas incerta]|eukprot:KAG2432450.1 hypothetical protein HXX76_008795 [Chlamydomonas incerta]